MDSKKSRLSCWVCFLLFCWVAGPLTLAAQTSFATGRYALILEDPPVSTRYASRQALKSVAAQSYQQQIEAKQATVRKDLSSRNIRVTGSVETLLNAIFVVAPEARVAELKSVPGVLAVVPLRRYKLKLNRATALVDATGAWNTLGIQNAGSGIKIAMLDTGIDLTHPAFQDPSLPTPAGYPICSGTDCAFTNNKVIVARSYVRALAAGTDPSNPAADSRPDDYSPRDRSGHGTATASCAAGVTNTGAVTITGMAPKAYLGNYKIFGSPEVNDFASDDVIIEALNDALNDGMDIASLSLGGVAFTGPLDSGSACGNPPGAPCDLLAQAVENSVKAGMLVVMAAGNEGQDGNFIPTFNTIDSPGDAPSGIAVGATTNSHTFAESVRVPGSGVPSNLQRVDAEFGDGYQPPGPVTAPLRDVTKLGDNGLACSSLPAGSLTGAFALIERGTCLFLNKLTNAQAAGAVGVIFYMANQTTIIAPGGLAGTTIPAVMLSNSDGVALKTFIDANADHLATIDPTPFEQSTSAYNLLAGFSSLGPSTGDSAVKPDLVAVGTNMYMAAERYDPLGDFYSPSGYNVGDGTSFATPLVSGAAALVKQSHPNFTPAQIKSALVNTATQDITEDDSGDSVGIQSIGGGKLDAGAAVNTTVTATPATLSFAVLTSTSSNITKQLQITNSGSSAQNLAIAVQATNPPPGVTLALDKQSLSLAAGASGTVNVTLSGALPSAGSYTGAVTIQGQGVSLRVPYLYLVGSGVAANIIPLTGWGFDGTVGEVIPDGMISFKLIDNYGVPVSGARVSFRAIGGGTLRNADTQTDQYGIAAAVPVLGSQPGTYNFIGSAGGESYTFSGNARLKPNIATNGIVNAASFEAGKAVAPGSYISIFGAGLSDTTDSYTTSILPLAIDYVNVSFDVPSAGISVPGRLTYVDSGQVNVQVPWELQGQSSVQVKVTIDFSYSNVYTLPLSGYSPAFFEIGGIAAARDRNNNIIGSANAAVHGQVIELFANGLGPVTNQPASGDPAPLSPLAQTTTTPTVTIGGKTAAVSFSGLAPDFAGLYQLDVTVPPDLSPGTYPITVAIGGQTSKASSIPVQ